MTKPKPTKPKPFEWHIENYSFLFGIVMFLASWLFIVMDIGKTSMTWETLYLSVMGALVCFPLILGMVKFFVFRGDDFV